MKANQTVRRVIETTTVTDLNMIDMRAPHNVEIEVRKAGDHHTLWVNVDGVCILRITRIEDEHLLVSGEVKRG